jgi:hypothetical protein
MAGFIHELRSRLEDVVRLGQRLPACREWMF